MYLPYPALKENCDIRSVKHNQCIQWWTQISPFQSCASGDIANSLSILGLRIRSYGNQGFCLNGQKWRCSTPNPQNKISSENYENCVERNLHCRSQARNFFVHNDGSHSQSIPGKTVQHGEKLPLWRSSLLTRDGSSVVGGPENVAHTLRSVPPCSTCV